MAISIPMEAVQTADEADTEAAAEQDTGEQSAAVAVQESAAEDTPPENTPQQETAAGSLPGSTDVDSALPDDVDKLKSELIAARKAVSDHEEFDSLIAELSAGIERQAATVLSCESAVESAKADLKYEREEYDKRVIELRKTIADRDGGQKRLPFGRLESISVASQVLQTAADRINAGELNGDGVTVTAEVTSSASTSAISPQTDDHLSDPISVLGQKEMIKLAGQDAWESAKNREEPFGMGKAEIETLEANEITTIGKLEKTMRENEWWHRDIPKFGEKKVAKLVESLRVFRAKYPQPA